MTYKYSIAISAGFLFLVVNKTKGKYVNTTEVWVECVKSSMLGFNSCKKRKSFNCISSDSPVVFKVAVLNFS